MYSCCSLFPPLGRLLSVRPRLSPILKWGDGESGHRFLPSFRVQERRILGWERRAFAPTIGRNWTRRPSVRRSAEPSLEMGRTEVSLRNGSGRKICGHMINHGQPEIRLEANCHDLKLRPTNKSEPPNSFPPLHSQKHLKIGRAHV